MKPVVTIGETLALVHSETPGSLVHASRLGLTIGGAESNVAIGLSRLGTAARWCGRVGADSLGELVLREIRAEGVDARASRDSERQTALMVKEQIIAGASRVNYYRAGSAGSQLSTADVDAADVNTAAVLHLTGISLAISLPARAAVMEAAVRANAAEVPISFDVNHRQALWSADVAAPHYRTLAAQSHVVFASLEEAQILVPHASTAIDAAHGIVALGARSAVIKLGEAGCCAVIDGSEYTHSGVRITPVDTVGAGDAFVAGYLSELVDGRPPRERLITANTVGAFACLSAADWSGYPRRNDLSLLSSDKDPVTR